MVLMRMRLSYHTINGSRYYYFYTEMPVKRKHSQSASSPDTKRVIVKSHMRSIKPRITETPAASPSIVPIDKHIDKPIPVRKRKAIRSGVSLTDTIKDIASKPIADATPNNRINEQSISANDTHFPSTPTSSSEPTFPIHSISKLVLAAIIRMLNGNLSMEFAIGNLRFTVDEILHHSSGIIDCVDKRLYSKFEHINKPYGIYSNEAFNFLAKNLKAVVGLPYKRALNELNTKLSTNFTTNGISEEIGAYDLSATTSDLKALGEYIRVNYDWFANGTVKRPGRGIDIITPAGISKLGSFKEHGEDVKITISRKKVTVERGNLEWADKKYIVQQRIPKTKFVLDVDNRRVTVPVMSQPLNLPFESVDNADTLTEIDGAYWRLVKTSGKTKYYQSPITNSRKPFLVVTG